MMRCSQCGRDNPADAKFCVGCGSGLVGRCLKCGIENPDDARFCKHCGVRLDSEPPFCSDPAQRIEIRDSVEPVSIDGERKTVTALFADIKGSMDLLEGLDPEEARRIIDPA